MKTILKRKLVKNQDNIIYCFMGLILIVFLLVHFLF